MLAASPPSWEGGERRAVPRRPAWLPLVLRYRIAHLGLYAKPHATRNWDTSHVSSFRMGVVAGVSYFIGELVWAVTGMLLIPDRWARNYGAAGFLFGLVYSPFAAVVLRPLYAFLMLIDRVITGLNNSVAYGNVGEPTYTSRCFPRSHTVDPFLIGEGEARTPSRAHKSHTRRAHKSLTSRAHTSSRIAQLVLGHVPAHPIFWYHSPHSHCHPPVCVLSQVLSHWQEEEEACFPAHLVYLLI